MIHRWWISPLDKYVDEAYCGADLEEGDTLSVAIEQIDCPECMRMKSA